MSNWAINDDLMRLQKLASAWEFYDKWCESNAMNPTDIKFDYEVNPVKAKKVLREEIIELQRHIKSRL